MMKRTNESVDHIQTAFDDADAMDESLAASRHAGIPDGRNLEAVLFAAALPVEISVLAEIFETDTASIEAGLHRLADALVSGRRGIALRVTGAGAELVTSTECAYHVEKIRKKEAILSPAATETLAVIAFRQPITRAEIEEIRGVNCERMIRLLVDKKLVRDTGKRDTIGRPTLYGTTEAFLRYAGIEAIEELNSETEPT